VLRLAFPARRITARDFSLVPATFARATNVWI
jgi:hypothetical protein